MRSHSKNGKKAKDQPTSPHDRFFKEMMSYPDVYQPFLARYLPENLSHALDLRKAKPAKDHFVEPQLRELYSDCLFSVGSKQGDLLVYVLVEHQSHPDHWMPLRLWRYVFAIWDHYRRKHKNAKTLPLILPILLHTGPKAYRKSLDIKDLIHAPREWIDSFLLAPPTLVDLASIKDEEIARQTCLGAMEIVLKHARDKPLSVEQVLLQLRQLDDGTLALNIIHAVFTYLFQVRGREEFQQIIAEATTLFPDAKGAEVMTIAEMLQEKGLEQGLEQGKRQNTQEIALRMVEKGFSDADIIEITGITATDLLELKKQTRS